MTYAHAASLILVAIVAGLFLSAILSALMGDDR